jgi:hypothetical protein
MLNSGGKKLYVKVSFCANSCIVLKWSLFNVFSITHAGVYIVSNSSVVLFFLGNAVVIQSGQFSGVQPSPAENISNKLHTSGYSSLQRYIYMAK